MAVITVDEFKTFCGITTTEYDTDFATWEPVVEAELPDLINKEVADIEDDRLPVFKSIVAEMVLWRIAQANPKKIMADPTVSQSSGRLSVTYEKLDPRTGYPVRIATRLNRYARPKKLGVRTAWRRLPQESFET